MRSGFIAAIAVFVMFGSVIAAPRPAKAPAQRIWTLDTVFENPAQIVMDLPGYEKPQRFWYIILTVTNPTNRDLDFYPQAQLLTDTCQILTAKPVNASVFREIQRIHKRTYPFLQTLASCPNKILQGPDHSLDIAIIWEDFDPQAKSVSFFITGLSNELSVVDHPTEKDENGEPRKVFLRKTLQLNYTIGGDHDFRSSAPVIFESRDWVMR